MDTLHALVCYSGAELARALWSRMGDETSNQLCGFIAFLTAKL
jgi:hypothetical protein